MILTSLKNNEPFGPVMFLLAAFLAVLSLIFLNNLEAHFSP